MRLLLLSKAEFQLCLPKALHFYLLHPAISALRSRGLSKPGSEIPYPEMPGLRSPHQQCRVTSSSAIHQEHSFLSQLNLFPANFSPVPPPTQPRTSSPSFPLSIAGRVFNSLSAKMDHQKFSIFTCNPFMSTQANQSIF